MSETLVERIKAWNETRPDDIMQAFSSDLYEIVMRAEATEARAAALESNNDEMQDYINEIRVALHTEKDELTIDAAKRIVAERDEARRELNALKRELSEAFNSGDGVYRP